MTFAQVLLAVGGLQVTVFRVSSSCDPCVTHCCRRALATASSAEKCTAPASEAEPSAAIMARGRSPSSDVADPADDPEVVSAAESGPAGEVVFDS